MQNPTKTMTIRSVSAMLLTPAQRSELVTRLDLPQDCGQQQQQQQPDNEHIHSLQPPQDDDQYAAETGSTSQERIPGHHPNAVDDDATDIRIGCQSENCSHTDKKKNKRLKAQRDTSNASPLALHFKTSTSALYNTQLGSSGLPPSCPARLRLPALTAATTSPSPVSPSVTSTKKSKPVKHLRPTLERKRSGVADLSRPKAPAEAGGALPLLPRPIGDDQNHEAADVRELEQKRMQIKKKILQHIYASSSPVTGM